MKKLALVGAVALAAQAANAGIIVVNASFTATDWAVASGTPAAPIDPVTVSYTATFNTELFYEANTSVLTDLVTNIPYPVTFP